MQNKAFLGVLTQENASGALVNDLVAGSPAAKAGVKVGDIITKINDIKITGPTDLFETIGKFKPAETITISIIRGEKKEKLTATLDANKVNEEMNTFNFRAPKKMQRGQDFNFSIPNMPQMDGIMRQFDKKPKLGISIEDLENGKGVRITKIMEGSPAAKAGLLVKDIIVKMDEKMVEEVNDIKWEVLQPGDTIHFEILRNSEKKTIQVKLPKKINTADL
jgi:serine protease Do